jgi:hypothetical protein
MLRSPQSARRSAGGGLGGSSGSDAPASRSSTFSSKARAGLDLYTPQDKFDAYKALALRVIAHPDSTQELIGGPLRSKEKTPST